MRSSQVSRIDPDHTGRWDKDRRMDLVRSWLCENDPSAMLTHEFDVANAPDAYRLLEERPDEAVQLVFNYP
jgi:alcohol dehydrogenase